MMKKITTDCGLKDSPFIGDIKIKGDDRMTQMTAFSEKSSEEKKIGDMDIFFLSPEGFKTLGHSSFASFL